MFIRSSQPTFFSLTCLHAHLSVSACKVSRDVSNSAMSRGSLCESGRHTCAQKNAHCRRAVGCCWFQLVVLTSDTGGGNARPHWLAGCCRNACVKGNWGQTVRPLGKEKRCKEQREGGATGHGLCLCLCKGGGGKEDPFRWDTKPEGHCVCVFVLKRH